MFSRFFHVKKCTAILTIELHYCTMFWFHYNMERIHIPRKSVSVVLNWKLSSSLLLAFISGNTGLELYHINGCLYKLEPTDEFSLGVGETKRATIVSSDWMVCMSNRTVMSIFKNVQIFQRHLYPVFTKNLIF